MINAKVFERGIDKMSASDAASGRWATSYHAPVLVNEVLDAFRGCRRILDGTLGGGGHTEALLEQGATVVALDQDAEAITAATDRLSAAITDGRLRIERGNFADIEELPELKGERFDGILLDLGISSHQIDDESRGFTFRPGAPLDMRMAADRGQSAADLLNDLPEAELEKIFGEYGDEPKARRLAREIVHRRQSRPFVTSDDLVGAIRATLGARSGPGDFARIFQGLRIAVNDEMDVLSRALIFLRERLESGGVLAVIAYHSGEDKRVKHAMREWSTACTCPPRQPMCTCGGVALGTLPTRKAIVSTEEEIARNPRSRSARLRLWRRA
jgi:16S rRNA (cytosine1402-N4)-methyltransferase